MKIANLKGIVSFLMLLHCNVLFAIHSDHDQLHSAYHDINFQKLTVNDGLTSNIISAIAQDSKGYIWIGTNKGLNRYDGKIVVTYQKEKTGQFNILNNRVRDIAVGVNDQLWVAVAGGLLRYEDSRDVFVPYTKTQGSPSSLLSNNLNVLFIDSQDRLWVGSAEGLSLYRPESDDFMHFPTGDNTQALKLPSGSVITVNEDDNGNLWVATLRNSSDTTNALSKIDLTTNSVTTFVHSDEQTDSLQAGAIVDIAITSAERLWLASSRGGLSRYLSDTETFFRLDELNNTLEPALDFESLRVSSVISDDDALWLSTIGDGLIRIDPLRNTYIQYLSDINDDDSLNANQLSDLFEDAQGNLWIGTLNRGVNIYYSRSSLFNSVKTQLPQDYIWSEVQSIIELGLSSHVIRTYDDLYFKVNPNSQEISERITYVEGNWTAALKGELIRLGDGTYLQLSNQRRLYRIKSNSNERVCVLKENNECADIAIKEIYLAENGGIWLSTFDRGLIQLDSTTEYVQTYSFSNNRVPSGEIVLTGTLINDIAEDPSGNIWVATNNGLNKLYPKLNRVDYFINDLDDDLSLPSREVLQIHVASEDSIWLATSNGLVKVTPTTEQFNLFDTEDGLASDDIRCMVADGNYIWFSTEIGLTQWNIAANSATNFYQSNGLHSASYTEFGCYKGDSGYFYFLNSEGYNYFDPNHFITIPQTAKPIITDVLIGEQRIPFADDTIIDLSYEFDVIQFEYDSINFSVPADDRFQVILENFDTTWRDMGATSAVFYSNLDVGNYQFKVRAIDRFGNVSEPVTVNINKLVHPLRSDFMIMVYLITVILLVIYFVRQNERKVTEQMLIAERERKIANQLRELSLHLENAREEERKYVARELHDELAQTLVVLRLDLRWIENTLEQGQSEQVVGRMPDINEVLDRGVSTVNKIAKGLRPSALDEIGINSAIESKLNEIAKRANIKPHFETNCRGLDLPDALRSSVYRIFQEGMTNILKHAKADNVWVALTLDDDRLLLSIKDDGIGIADSDLDKSGSFGMIGMRERVNANGGSLNIVSNKGKGTLIQIQIILHHSIE